MKERTHSGHETTTGQVNDWPADWAVRLPFLELHCVFYSFTRTDRSFIRSALSLPEYKFVQCVLSPLLQRSAGTHQFESLHVRLHPLKLEPSLALFFLSLYAKWQAMDRQMSKLASWCTLGRDAGWGEERERERTFRSNLNLLLL